MQPVAAPADSSNSGAAPPRGASTRLTLLVATASDDTTGTGPKPGGASAAPVRGSVVPHRELIAAQLFAAGALGVWEPDDDTLVAWFAHGPIDLPDELGAHAQWDTEPDRDWQSEWKATIAPVDAGRFVIVPSWLADGSEQSGPGAAGAPPTAARRPERVVIVIDPGRAFGTGHHATTAMCLELLDELADQQSPVAVATDPTLDGMTLLDLGCGSGILAIAAAKLGARVTAIDTDPEAVAVTAENRAVNNVSPDVLTTGIGSVELLTGPFDVVVANIITDTIAALASELNRLTAPQGTLIVSGISIERSAHALGPLQQLGWKSVARVERHGWLAAALRHHGRHP